MINKELELLENGWTIYTPTTYVKDEWMKEPVGGPNWYRHESLESAWDIYQNEKSPN